MWRQGDASLCFLKRPSCELAIDLLDEVELRDGFVSYAAGGFACTQRCIGQVCVARLARRV